MFVIGPWWGGKNEDNSGNKIKKSLQTHETTVTPQKIRDVAYCKSVSCLHAQPHYLLCGVLPSGMYYPHNDRCQAAEEEQALVQMRSITEPRRER